MAPERLSSMRKTLPVKPSTDIWSLGIILYELLTGETPYQGGSSSEILEDIYYRKISEKQVGSEPMRLIKAMLRIREGERVVLNEIQKSEFLSA